MIGKWRILTAWFVVAVLVLSSAAVYAGDRADGSFFLKNIVVNGEEIVNYNLQYPFFLYEDVTYLPLTADIQEIFGFAADVDVAAGTLTLRKTTPTLVNIKDNHAKNNAENVVAEVESRMRVRVVDAAVEASPPSSPVSAEGLAASISEDANDLAAAPVLPGEANAASLQADAEDIALFDPAPRQDARTVDLGQNPVLVMNNVVYLPLRAFAGNEALGWNLYYDPYFGICVSTNEDVPAQNFFPEAEAKYNKGLVQYIRSVNGNLSAGHAQELVFMIRRAAETNKLDEKVLIAVVQKESRFNANAVSRSGAVGLMQFMPRTAAGLGLDVSQLYDPKTSIDYGAAYLSRNIEYYDGNVDLALTAYNQGSGSVSRGAYSRVYAEKVQDAVEGIDAYLEEGGYIP
jgi:hypothetical protein